MTVRLKTLFFIGFGFVVLWFLYVERAILTPFILGAVAAYLFNPLVNFFSHYIKLPRTLSVIIIYCVIIFLIGFLGTLLTRRVFVESIEFKNAFDQLMLTAQNEVKVLPEWMRPTLQETLNSIERSKLFSPQSLFVIFPEALSRVVSFIIFLFSGFYFLREGRSMLDKLFNFAPENYRIELDILANKINAVLGAYLRGQIFMVFLVSAVLFILLSILGVDFALLLAIFSGFAEIVPIIGPIVAASVAAIVVLLGGTANFPMSPFQGAVVVIVIYTVVRQIQDYFIIPPVMGRITKLHPLIILFAVLAGEHIWGILGLILAVPVAASLRILLEYSLDKIYETEQET